MDEWATELETIECGCKKEGCDGMIVRRWDVKLDEDGAKCEECGEWQ